MFIDVDGGGPDLPPTHVAKALLNNHPIGLYALLMSNNTSPNQLYKWVNKTSSDPMAFYKIKGAFGEAEAFKRLYKDFTISKYGPGIPAPVTLLGAKHNGLQVDVQSKVSSYTSGGIVRIRHSVGIRNFSFDGRENELAIYGKEKDAQYTINYEIKTLSPNNPVGFNFRMLAEGVQQTLDRAKGENTIGVLVTDKQTWENVSNDPVYGPQLKSFYDKLTQLGNGAYLRLEENLNSAAHQEVMKARTTVKQAIDSKKGKK